MRERAILKNQLKSLQSMYHVISRHYGFLVYSKYYTTSENASCRRWPFPQFAIELEHANINAMKTPGGGIYNLVVSKGLTWVT